MTQSSIGRHFRILNLREKARLDPQRMRFSRVVRQRAFVLHDLIQKLPQLPCIFGREAGSGFTGVDQVAAFVAAEIKRVNTEILPIVGFAEAGKSAVGRPEE
jgi:hypothetical protein